MFTDYLQRYTSKGEFGERNSDYELPDCIGLKRFSLRGKVEVNAQWLMFCMVHNLKKIRQFGLSFA